MLHTLLTSQPPTTWADVVITALMFGFLTAVVYFTHR